MSHASRRKHSHRLLVMFCLLGAFTLLGPAATLHADPLAQPLSTTAAVLIDSHTLPAELITEPPEDNGDEEADKSPESEESDEAAPSPDETAEEAREEAADEDAKPAENEEQSATESEDDAATQAAEAEDKSNSPQVEVYIPSVTGLIEAYRRSHSARLFEAFAGMVPKLESETDDDFDFASVLAILERIAEWPDTSIALTTYTQDREGRPRWAVRVDWPLADLRERVGELLDLEETKKLMKDISIRTQEDGSWVLELPDMVLAVIKAHGDGALIAATADLVPPELVFGQKPLGDIPSRARSGRGTMIYCRLNMEAGEESEKRRSMLSAFSIASDIRYAASIDSQGQWKERFNVRWNPLIGLGVKTLLKKTSKSFDCPRESYIAGALHLAMGEGIVDTLAGLDAGTIGARAGGDMAFAVLPGEGFFPIPDVFYQLNVRRIDRIKKAIREAIEEDADRRKDDDRPPAWHEEEYFGKVVFWRDPSVDQRGNFSLATFRTVLFFELADRNEEGSQDRLIIASTSMQAEDAVHRWRELRRRPKKEWVRLPDSSKTHWQMIVNWKAGYELVQPYLSVFASTSETGESAPRPSDLADSLSHSIIDVKIEFAGLDVRHTGPLPIGAAYVPGVTFASLSATADPGSEAARERLACRNLRVLHHHASLFKKDYGRWPATVAELDGYVDFTSHPNLLNIRPKDDGFLKGFVSIFTVDKRSQERAERDDDEIDDALYEIEWDEEEWKLKFRENEFVNYLTIYIDHEGHIHRVPKPDADDDADDEDVEEESKDSDDMKEMARR